MKKLIAFLKDLWEFHAAEVLEWVATFITMGWFVYLVDVVKQSDGGILGKAFFFVWSLVLAFIYVINRFTKDS